jgi:hypothetical protein
MKLSESKRLANEQFFFRAVIRVSLVDPKDAAKLGDGDGPPAAGYVQAFIIMADSPTKALALLEEALGGGEYEKEHPEGKLEQVELTVLGEDELNKEILDAVKERTSAVLLRSNASPVPAENA